MTPQEAQMLQDLVRKVEGTQLTEKDPDAEALLNDGLARDPDALYKLAQTVLIQNIALDQAHTQLQRMQQQLGPSPQPARAASFLGGLFHPGATQSAPPPPPPQYQAAPPNYPPPPAYAPPPVYGAPSAAGGFLRSAATTAAGVAGGMLAFQGIESLLHGGLGGWGGGWGGGYGPGMPVGETVVNNYYDNPSGQQGAWQGGPDEQPQGPYDDGGSGAADAQDYVDDSGGQDDGGYDDGGGFDQV